VSDDQTLAIRDAFPAEIQAMVALTLDAYAQFAPLIPTSLWEGYRANIIETLSAPDPVERIVAARDGTLVGSVLLFLPRAAAGADHTEAPTLPYIRLLAVPPAARGRGVAKALMAECLRRVQAMGAQAIDLHTMDMMDVAMRMYERMGFVREPSTDWPAAEGVLVKGYRLDLPAADSTQPEAR
jgi:ribosomal protein S18 acetylase RimI-like enzyme